MALWRLLVDHCPPCAQQIDLIATKLKDFKPGDWTDWAQLITSVIGVLWIIYQFNRLRRSAEKDLEDYLKRHLDEKLRDFKRDRARVLPIFDRVTQASGLDAFAGRIIALCKRLMFALLRLLPIVPNPSELSHALVLYRAGSTNRARKKFDIIANKLLDLAMIYEKQAKVKRCEAGDAFLYSGCAAASSGDTSGSLSAFKQVLDKVSNTDLDALELAGRQHLNANSFQQALGEFELLQQEAAKSEDRAREALAHRLKAQVHRGTSHPVLARNSLRQSLKIEKARNDQSGIGETLELLGDVYREQNLIPAARNHYQQAIQANRIVPDHAAVVRIAQRVRDLTPNEEHYDTRMSRFLFWLSEGLRALALRLSGRSRRQ
jgi:tetratricopeptide (TPR) repeat protein